MVFVRGERGERSALVPGKTKVPEETASGECRLEDMRQLRYRASL